MTEELEVRIQEKAEPSASRKLRTVLADAFTFIRSREANQAIATVTFEQLMTDQIRRNGDTDKSNSAQYNPYLFDPNKPMPEGMEPGKRANFIGGADTQRPTKIDMILAMKNEIDSVVEEIKNTVMTEVANYAAYADAPDEAPVLVTPPEGITG